ncbi:MAG: MFS transporter [Chloroflexota bacterium]|nr:MFS transporter [Chloroflexota bacterium]
MSKQVGRRFGVLRERNFRLFFAGYLTSIVGTGMVPVALTFAVLNQGGGASDVGYVLAAQTAPLVAFLLVGGVIADRVPRRAVMMTADLARCASEGVLAALLVTGHPPLWAFMGLAAVLGAGSAFYNPALTGLIPEISSSARLQDANALRNVAVSAGQVVGPVAAGLIVAVAGAGWAIAVDAATYAVSAACLSRLRVPLLQLGPPESFLAQLASGWREFRSRTWLWVIVTQFAFFHVIVYAPFIVLGAVTAKTALGGAAAWGTILAAQGIGSVVGALATLRMRPARPLVVGMMGTCGFAAPIALLAAKAPTSAIAVAGFVGGFGLAVFTTLWQTTIQREIPAPVLSRVSAYDWFGSVAFFPLGYAVAGPLAASLGIAPTLWLAAGWLVVSSGCVLAVPSVARLRWNAPVVAPGL